MRSEKAIRANKDYPFPGWVQWLDSEDAERRLAAQVAEEWVANHDAEGVKALMVLVGEDVDPIVTPVFGNGDFVNHTGILFLFEEKK